MGVLQCTWYIYAQFGGLFAKVANAAQIRPQPDGLREQRSSSVFTEGFHGGVPDYGSAPYRAGGAHGQQLFDDIMEYSEGGSSDVEES